MIDEVIIQSLTDEVNFINKETERTGNNPIDLIVCIDAEVLVHALKLIHRLQSEKERLTGENLALSKGVKRLKKRYEKTIRQNSDEVVKKFCETTMYVEQERLVKQNAELQKQVDELKETLKLRNEQLEDIRAYDKEIVKDTAKEIISYLEDKYHWGMITPFNRLLQRLKERYSIEVE